MKRVSYEVKFTVSYSFNKLFDKNKDIKTKITKEFDSLEEAQSVQNQIDNCFENGTDKETFNKYAIELEIEGKFVSYALVYKVTRENIYN